MRKTLVTSFEPFAGRSENLSASVAHRLRELGQGLPLEFGSLPVTFSGVFPQLKEFIKSVQPEVVLLLGEALGAEGVRLERYAHNWCFSSTADNEGRVLRGEKVLQEGPECLLTTVDLPELLVHPKVRLSLSAGAFVCNSVYYQALLSFSPQVECLFVHVTDLISVEEQAQILKTLLEKLTLSDSEVDGL